LPWSLPSLFEYARKVGFLSTIVVGIAPIRCSTYVDDVALFFKPIQEELLVPKAILEAFVKVSGLVMNLSKRSVIPIRCGYLDLANQLAPLGTPITHLPLPQTQGRYPTPH
jgi:hypothetical protein